MIKFPWYCTVSLIAFWLSVASVAFGATPEQAEQSRRMANAGACQRLVFAGVSATFDRTAGVCVVTQVAE